MQHIIVSRNIESPSTAATIIRIYFLIKTPDGSVNTRSAVGFVAVTLCVCNRVLGVLYGYARVLICATSLEIVCLLYGKCLQICKKHRQDNELLTKSQKSAIQFKLSEHMCGPSKHYSLQKMVMQLV